MGERVRTGGPQLHMESWADTFQDRKHLSPWFVSEGQGWKQCSSGGEQQCCAPSIRRRSFLNSDVYDRLWLHMHHEYFVTLTCEPSLISVVSVCTTSVRQHEFRSLDALH